MWNRFFLQTVKIPVDLIHATVLSALGYVEFIQHELQLLGTLPPLPDRLKARLIDIANAEALITGKGLTGVYIAICHDVAPKVGGGVAGVVRGVLFMQLVHCMGAEDDLKIIGLVPLQYLLKILHFIVSQPLIPPEEPILRLRIRLDHQIVGSRNTPPRAVNPGVPPSSRVLPRMNRSRGRRHSRT